MNLLSLSVGAILGAALRHYVSLWAAADLGSRFPYGTLIVNLVGTFILGFFLALGTRWEASPAVRLFVATGFCGSLTTFSTFSAETVALLGEGRFLPATLNVLGSLLAGWLCVVLGAALAQLLSPR